MKWLFGVTYSWWQDQDQDQIWALWTSSSGPFLSFSAGTFYIQSLSQHTSPHSTLTPASLGVGNQIEPTWIYYCLLRTKISKEGQRVLARFLVERASASLFSHQKGFCHREQVADPQNVSATISSLQLSSVHDWPVLWGSGGKGRDVKSTFFLWILLLSLVESERREFKQQNHQISLRSMSSLHPQRWSWTDRFLVS